MQHKWVYVLITAAMFVLAACAPDPRNEAEADRIRQQSNTAAANADQLRTQQQAEWDLKQAERQAVTQEVVSAWKAAIPWLFGFAAFCVVLFGLVLTVSASFTTVGLGRAVVIAATNKAYQISMDPRTFSFPLVLSADGKYLADANTRTNMPRLQAQEPHPQMVDSLRTRAEIALENYQAAHGLQNHVRIEQSDDL